MIVRQLTAVAMRYVLPVLCTTSCWYIMARNKRCEKTQKAWYALTRIDNSQLTPAFCIPKLLKFADF